MRPRIPLDPELRRGPFTVSEGREAGFGERRLAGRDLSRPFHGVRTPRDLGDGIVTRCAAFATRCTHDAFFSHVTAATLWEVPLPTRMLDSRMLDSRIDVSVPRPRRAPEGTGVRGHSVRVNEADIAERHGLPVSTPARLWCELGSVLGVDDLVVAGDFLIRRADPLVSPDELATALERAPGRRGLCGLREALDLIDDRAESPQESRIRMALVRAKIPGMGVNVPVRGASGRVYRADFAFLDRGIVLEYQGDYHRERSQFRRDLTRSLDLQTAGMKVILLGPDDTRSEPEFVERMRTLLRLHPERRQIDLPGPSEGRFAATRREGAREGARERA
ncbi:MAG TPA: hypothetical protein VGN33_03800 [Leifsonia sp.]|nr:hypothetical protein [Leifsonia sp.]